MKRIALGLSGIALAVGAAWSVAEETLPASGTGSAVAAPTMTEQYSYAIGLDMGTSFRSSETQLDIESLVAGLQAGLGGTEPKYDQATCGAALQQLQIEMRKKAMAQQQVAGSKNIKLGADFLAKNKSRKAYK